MLHDGEMLENIAQRRRLALALVAALILSLTSVLAPSAFAKSTVVPASKLTMQVSAGFNTRYRSGSWVPLYVTLYNNGAHFSGMLAASRPPCPVFQRRFTSVPR